MSIPLEVQRLENAKSDIASAIREKGVTVPSTAKIDTFGYYVRQISGPSPTPSGGLMEVSAEEFAQRIQQRATAGEITSYTPVGTYGLSFFGVLISLVPCIYEYGWGNPYPMIFSTDASLPPDMADVLGFPDYKIESTQDSISISDPSDEWFSRVEWSVDGDGTLQLYPPQGAFDIAEPSVTYYVF